MRPTRNPALRHAALLVACAFPFTAALAGEPTCEAAPHRAFDFWIGTWEVFLPDGKKAGDNVIEAFAGRCGLLESWTGRGGVTGKSINAYDAADGRWHQTWVDSTGGRLELAGGPRGDAMILASAPAAAKPGESPRLERITWSPGPEGSVRQLWEYSEDGGKSWKIAFDGRYVRRNAGASAAPRP